MNFKILNSKILAHLFFIYPLFTQNTVFASSPLRSIQQELSNLKENEALSAGPTVSSTKQCTDFSGNWTKGTCQDINGAFSPETFYQIEQRGCDDFVFTFLDEQLNEEDKRYFQTGIPVTWYFSEDFGNYTSASGVIFWETFNKNRLKMQMNGISTIENFGVAKIDHEEIYELSQNTLTVRNDSYVSIHKYSDGTSTPVDIHSEICTYELVP